MSKRSPRKRMDHTGAYLLCERCDTKMETPSWCPLCRECYLEEFHPNGEGLPNTERIVEGTT